MNQLEDDLHRVLQLARAQSRLPRTTRRAAKASPASPQRNAQQRHRHEHSTERQRKHTPPPTLLRAKLQGISAIYGLEAAVPTLSDCSTRTARAQLERLHAADEAAAASRDDPAKLEAALAARRARYKRHFSGLQAAYGPTGRPKLECLLDAAQRAKETMARHAALAVGASVLTSGNRIYASSTIESAHDTKFTVCAERAALLKALGEDAREVVIAMAICSDATVSPPCGSCREFMAECGDFPVFLVSARGDIDETRSFELFPRARQCSTVKVVQQQHQVAIRPDAHQGKQVATAASSSSSAEDAVAGRSESLPLNVQDWTTEHVQQWLTNTAELPQYCDIFARSGVDGCTLLHLEASDLQLLLGVLQPLDRRRLLVHIDRLKDRELLEHGIDYGQLQDYLAVLDRDRITVVAELKATFDRLDVNRDGFLDFAQVRQALSTLHCDATAEAVEALMRSPLLSKRDDGQVAFPDFAAAFSTLAMQQPATERRGLAADVPVAWQLPVLDLAALRGTFDKTDVNKSGSVDVQELAALFQRLASEKAQTQQSADDYARRARAWLDAADQNGDGRLSFAEFLERYIQLTGVDISKLSALFDEVEPLASAHRKPVRVLQKALETFFPDVSPVEVAGWYKRHLTSSLLHPSNDTDDSGDASSPPSDSLNGPNDKSSEAASTAAAGAGAAPNKARLTISRSDFVLAVFLFQEHVRDRRQQMRELKGKLTNDALVHKSRVVHLQQSGHVRMCPQTTSTAVAADGTATSLAATRRAQVQQRQEAQRRKLSESEDEAKGKSESEDDDRAHAKRQRRQLALLLAKVDATFDRFARAKVAKKRGGEARSPRPAPRRRTRSDSDDEAKGRDGDSSDDADDGEADLDACALNALETTQAMTELGIACPRDQMLRLLQEEGVGIHDSVDRQDFRRLFRHWHALSASALGSFPSHRRSGPSACFWNEDTEHARRMDEMAALLRGEYGRHPSRQDYDAYLLRGRQQHQRLDKQRAKPLAVTVARARKPWTSEMVRLDRERQAQRRRGRHIQGDDEAKGASGESGREDTSSSSDASQSARGRRRRRSVSRSSRRRISQSRSRTEHSQQRRSTSQQRQRCKNNRRHRSRRRGSRSSCASRSSLSSSSEATTSECDDDRARHHHPRQKQLAKRRGVEIGDRVTAQGDGSGTVIRLHRDYFVADVHFDSGKRAKNVDLSKLTRVHPLDEAAAVQRLRRQQEPALVVGTPVAVAHRGTATVRRGKITVCRLDGTFDVLVNELGEHETLKRVQRKHLRALTGKPLVYLVGARVTVRQKHAYLRGRVELCRTDGSYDVCVRPDKRVLKRLDIALLSPDDSDNESGDESLDDTKDARAKQSTSRKSREVANEAKQDDDDGDGFEPEFARGERVEARFQGRDAFYPGTITRVLPDGTFDIEYDDGDCESRVKSHLIRSKAPVRVSSNSQRREKEDDYGDDGFESS